MSAKKAQPAKKTMARKPSQHGSPSEPLTDEERVYHERLAITEGVLAEYDAVEAKKAETRLTRDEFFLTAPQAAKRLGVTTAKLSRMIARREIGAIHPAAGTRVPLPAIEAYQRRSATNRRAIAQNVTQHGLRSEPSKKAQPAAGYIVSKAGAEKGTSVQAKGRAIRAAQARAEAFNADERIAELEATVRRLRAELHAWQETVAVLEDPKLLAKLTAPRPKKMPATFADLVRMIELEARAEGPEAEAQLETLRARFRGVKMPKTVTVQVAAKRLDLSIGSIKRRVDAGLLDGYKDPVTGGYHVSAQAIANQLDLRGTLRRSAALPRSEGPRVAVKKPKRVSRASAGISNKTLRARRNAKEVPRHRQ